MAETQATCDLCQLAEGAGPAGGWLVRNSLVSGYISPANRDVPGWCQLQVNRHAGNLSALTAAEAAAIGVAAQELGTAIVAVTGASRIYSYSICEVIPHFHMVLGPPPEVRPGEARGPVLLSRVLARDHHFADPAAAAEVADQLRAALG